MILFGVISAFGLVTFVGYWFGRYHSYECIKGECADCYYRKHWEAHAEALNGEERPQGIIKFKVGNYG